MVHRVINHSFFPQNHHFTLFLITIKNHIERVIRNRILAHTIQLVSIPNTYKQPYYADVIAAVICSIGSARAQTINVREYRVAAVVEHL